MSRLAKKHSRGKRSESTNTTYNWPVACCNATQRNTTRRNATQRNTTRRNATRHVATQLNTSQRNATQRNTSQRNATQYDTSQRGVLRTQCNTLQLPHNTTRHSTAVAKAVRPSRQGLLDCLGKRRAWYLGSSGRCRRGRGEPSAVQRWQRCAQSRRRCGMRRGRLHHKIGGGTLVVDEPSNPTVLAPAGACTCRVRA